MPRLFIIKLAGTQTQMPVATQATQPKKRRTGKSTHNNTHNASPFTADGGRGRGRGTGPVAADGRSTAPSLVLVVELDAQQIAQLDLRRVVHNVLVVQQAGARHLAVDALAKGHNSAVVEDNFLAWVGVRAAQALGRQFACEEGVCERSRSLPLLSPLPGAATQAVPGGSFCTYSAPFFS